MDLPGLKRANDREILKEHCLLALSPSEDILRERFGLEGFRRGQREILSSVLAGRDVMAVLPTGGGKSLCYQYPALAKGELVVVISPLIALMKDQVSSLTARGIPAGCLHSAQSDEEKRDVFRRIGDGGPFLLYLSPERAQKDGFQRWIKARRIALFAVDEAHCVSQWGHDFREEYAQLKILKELRPDVPVLALTASATPLVLNDVARNLALKSPAKHVHGFYRSNLYYQVETCADDDSKLGLLIESLKKFANGRVIIYCGTRRATEELASVLGERFEGVGFYHAGLPSGSRTDVQDAYARGDLRILVATNAFGMGIDHPDVRLVVHFQMPANIDSLYQEMGRAGRDGQHSTCLLLYSRKDKGLQSYFIQSSAAPADIKSSRWNTLEALVSYAEGGECRHAEILTYYKDAQRIEACGHCDVCDPASVRKVPLPAPAPPRVIRRSPEDFAPSAGEGRRSEARSSRRSSRSKGIDWDSPLSDEQQLRFEVLKDWRKGKAKELDVPAFVVFSDRTLKHLSVANPRRLTDLAAIHGFGETKMQRFGEEVIERLGALP